MRTNEERVLENRCRRRVAARGWTLSRSRVRDPFAIGYGEYTLTRDDREQRFPNLTELAAWVMLPRLSDDQPTIHQPTDDFFRGEYEHLPAILDFGYEDSGGVTLTYLTPRELDKAGLGPEQGSYALLARKQERPVIHVVLAQAHKAADLLPWLTEYANSCDDFDREGCRK